MVWICLDQCEVQLCLSQMEKYSKHLEVLVAERTQDLMHEKQRTDRLLYSMTHIDTAENLTSVFLMSCFNLSRIGLYADDTVIYLVT